MKPLTLTIVIPVYNEEARLRNCLDAIAMQNVAPDEVIVVDNNSTDDSVQIAKSYKFVKVLHQPIKGLIATRNLGFDHAKCELVSRIDADCELLPNWVEICKESFSDVNVDAVAGLALTRTFWQSFVPRSRLWSLVYMYWTEAEFGIPILWGANMAMRKSAWNSIKASVCLNDNLVHEDQDLSYLLSGSGKKIVRNNSLLVIANGDDYQDWQKLKEYSDRRLKTKQLHKGLGTTSRPNSVKISGIGRLLRYCAVIVPGIAFVVTSPLIFILHKTHQKI